MLRFTIGTSVLQFRKHSVLIGLAKAVFVVFLVYFIIRYLYSKIPDHPISDLKTEIDKGELSLLEQRLERLEKELQRNRIMLTQVKDTVRSFLQPESPPLVPFSFGSALSRANRSLVKLSPYDCQFCSEPIADADENTLDMYEKIDFDNKDGGVWKQGWDLQYDPNQWSEQKKLKIFVVPHSHNDPGWIKTFEKYFKDQTQHILNNLVLKMKDDKRRKFIWAEISYFAMWWEKVDRNTQLLVKRLLNDGQLEIVTGGWVMNDEATAHYFAMIEQMIEGHQWLEQNLEYKPKNGWAIDPFGLSPTMAYMLRRMGLDNMVVQRVHYSIKKYLAELKSLEFVWRQQWDHNHTMDILCHTMPFYSYDIPHSCGPDPKVCCQFDFKRLPGNKVNCPWRVPPVPITDKNVADRAWMLLDQYRKKSQLFRSNVVMIQLGDDFRYDKPNEWDQQFNNYQKLFDYINSRDDWHAEAKFGTLEDYFSSLRADTGIDDKNMPSDFPSLVGDFFTYADRDDHYWSGYFTSRPFYKNMDRALEAHLRGAEILFSLMVAKIDKQVMSSVLPYIAILMSDLVASRRTLSLFQHHDAITGTSKDHVVIDYASKMFAAFQKLRNIIGQCAVFLLAPNFLDVLDEQFALLQTDEYRHHSAFPTKVPIKFTGDRKDRYIVLYNSLGQSRNELVRVIVTTPAVQVKDSTGNVIPCQINPVFKKNNLLSTEYELIIYAELSPLSLTTYTIQTVEDDHSNSYRAAIKFINVDKIPTHQSFHMIRQDAPDVFSVKSDYFKGIFSGPTGMLQKLICLDDGSEFDIKIKFLKYGTKTKGKDKSGAYLFLPDSEAKPVDYNKPQIRILEGPLMSEVTVILKEVEHHVYFKNSPGLDGFGIDIYNVVNIATETNKELIMRFYTNITNDNQDFYTDLNGMQMIRRHYFDKLPIQANVYPVSTMAYFQDHSTRFSLLTAHSVGATSLQPGWFEVFLDRRLNQDDNRGLQQGVTDNRDTPTFFRIMFEHRNKKGSSLYPSLLAHQSSLSLLHAPFVLMRMDKDIDNVILRSPDAPLKAKYSVGIELPCDVHLLNLRTLQALSGSTIVPSNITALFLHRIGFDCNFKMWGLCSTRNGTVSVEELFPNLFSNSVEEASLSLMYTGSKFSKDAHIQLPPMEIVTLKLSQR
ncbi:alpha-mannosidase 2x-like [Uloborus diversus]|uniref:alpha-mannosidase 2x-like n=1 Tax=Uloborus diversus TaxID=327109 RepID=UPI00240A217C|nr:alpha-mannosidase 2x-like [Uloborus diversus]